MSNFVPLRRSQHSEHSWSRPTGYAFAAQQMLAPIIGSELAHAVLHLPLAFVRQHSDFQLVAVLALRNQQNLFVAPDGSWLAAAHIPLALRSYPFALARLSESDQVLLTVDEASPLVHADGSGEPFFGADGQLTPTVAKTLQFLETTERSRRSTHRAVQALAEAGVIVPWELSLRSGDQQGAIEGLFRIDEAGLNALSPEAFEPLRQLGALPLAYGQLFSAQHLPGLAQLAAVRTAPAGESSETQAKPSAISGYDQIINFQDLN